MCPCGGVSDLLFLDLVIEMPCRTIGGSCEAMMRWLEPFLGSPCRDSILKESGSDHLWARRGVSDESIIPKGIGETRVPHA